MISELVTIDHGKYIVKVAVTQEGVILGTALAANDTIEKAEDEARKRAIAVVNWSKNETLSDNQAKKEIITPQSPKKDSIPQKIKPEIITKTFPTPPITQDLPPLEKQSKTIEENEDLWESYNTNEIKENPHEVDTSISPLENINENEISNTDINNISLFENENNKEETATNNLILFPELNSKELSEPTLPLEYSETIDFSQIIDQTSIEMKRLAWTQEQGKKYLLETYGKKSRHLLSDHELIEFLNYLQNQ
ncbi:hypothetical protein GM3709_3497 [Geminocystis sp. NIES-3709]|nr:hypothetical protein GM3709_3497 [Geminocystis sp. NIES-3709]